MEKDRRKLKTIEEKPILKVQQKPIPEESIGREE